MIHLVNCRQGDILSNLPVDLEIGAGKSVRGVRVLSPDREGRQELEYTIEGDRCRFNVPLLEVYDVLVVELGRS